MYDCKLPFQRKNVLFECEIWREKHCVRSIKNTNELRTIHLAPFQFGVANSKCYRAVTDVPNNETRPKLRWGNAANFKPLTFLTFKWHILNLMFCRYGCTSASLHCGGCGPLLSHAEYSRRSTRPGGETQSPRLCLRYTLRSHTHFTHHIPHLRVHGHLLPQATAVPQETAWSLERWVKSLHMFKPT